MDRDGIYEILTVSPQDMYERGVEQLKQQQERIDLLLANYTALWDLLEKQPGMERAEKRELILDNGFDHEILGRGKIVYSLQVNPYDPKPNVLFSQPSETSEFTSTAWFVGSSSHLSDNSFEKKSKEEKFKWRFLRTARGHQGHQSSIDEQELYLLSVLPKQEETFEMVLEAACDPELNPGLAEEAQELRDSLQTAA